MDHTENQIHADVVPAHDDTPVQVPPRPRAPRGAMPMARRVGGRRMLWSGAAILVILVVLFGVVFAGIQHQWWLNQDSSINKNEYQALFLTNGQVYFGKLTDLNGRYVTITDVYYLEVQQNLQESESTANASNGSKVSLAKLGSELHAPEDEMFVATDQVLFWENLKNDGKVAQAINQYQASQGE